MKGELMFKSFIILALVIGGLVAKDPRVFIPVKAKLYLDTLYEIQEQVFEDFFLPSYFGALIEHESCSSLVDKRCWSPTSRFKTPREEGVGFGMLTRAFRSNGKLRFDTLTELSLRYPELRELSWKNATSRPDLQLTAVVIKIREIFKRLPDSITDYNKLLMTDSAYNGGEGGLRKDRRLCGLRKGCDPNVWFGNVELSQGKSSKPLYGKRSAYSINRHHVEDVIKVRWSKYYYDRLERKK